MAEELTDEERLAAGRRWARAMYERDVAWQVYEALRDGLNTWRMLTEDQLHVPTGFYGQDYDDDG